MLTHAFMWRIILAAVITALLIATLPQATEAATKRQRCIAAAERALGRDIRASDYRIVLGTNRDYEVLRAREGRKDLICGFGGSEEIPRGTAIRSGDIFISGRGGSLVRELDGGLVIGGDDEDNVHWMTGGRFEGRGNGDHVDGLLGGVYFGGDGADGVRSLFDGGRFLGGRGADSVDFLHGGVFRGKRAADEVWRMEGGRFYGGSGTDRVRGYVAGKLFSVEVCWPAKACP